MHIDQGATLRSLHRHGQLNCAGPPFSTLIPQGIQGGSVPPPGSSMTRRIRCDATAVTSTVGTGSTGNGECKHPPHASRGTAREKAVSRFDRFLSKASLIRVLASKSRYFARAMCASFRAESDHIDQGRSTLVLGHAQRLLGSQRSDHHERPGKRTTGCSRATRSRHHSPTSSSDTSRTYCFRRPGNSKARSSRIAEPDIVLPEVACGPWPRPCPRPTTQEPPYLTSDVPGRLD